jgi:hypothetical protein
MQCGGVYRTRGSDDSGDDNMGDGNNNDENGSDDDDDEEEEEDEDDEGDNSNEEAEEEWEMEEEVEEEEEEGDSFGDCGSDTSRKYTGRDECGSSRTITEKVKNTRVWSCSLSSSETPTVSPLLFDSYYFFF